MVHIVPGTDRIGGLLAGHELVGRNAFTGSPTTGVPVIKTTADNLPPTLMDLAVP